MRVKRRWQWSLRSLFVLMSLCAIVSLFASRRREQKAIEWLRKQGAEITVVSSGPEWLRALVGDKWFEHAIRVQCGYTADGVRLQSDDVAMLSRLPQLYSLDLCGMEISDDVLPALGRLPSLESLCSAAAASAAWQPLKGSPTGVRS